MKSVDELHKGTAALVGRTTAQLRERNNPDEKVVYGRHLLAYALDKLWAGESDHGRVLSNLDCSPSHLRVAIGMATGGSETAERFRQDARKILGEPEPVVKIVADLPKPDKKPAERSEPVDPETILFRIAKECYGMDRDALLKGFKGALQIRRVIVFIGKRAYGLKTRQMAVILRSTRPDVTEQLSIALYEYDYDNNFRKEVDDICKLFGIKLKLDAIADA
jgi:hypothetical protein